MRSNSGIMQTVRVDLFGNLNKLQGDFRTALVIAIFYFFIVIKFYAVRGGGRTVFALLIHI